MPSQRTLLVAVAAASVLIARSNGYAAASPGVEEQQPIFNSESQDVEDDSYWTQSPLYQRAETLMKASPLIDTHIDLPQIIRSLGEHIHITLHHSPYSLTTYHCQIVIQSLSFPISRLIHQAISTSPACERATLAQPSGPSGRHAQTSSASTSGLITTSPTTASATPWRSSTSSTR